MFFLKVLFYSTEIFAAAGVPYSEVATIVVGITLLVFTIVTVTGIYLQTFLFSAHLVIWALPFFFFSQVFLVEIVGRRTLMLYGLGGMAICFALLTTMFCFKVRKFPLLAMAVKA